MRDEKRYQAAERRFWEECGLAPPAERFVALDRPRLRVRIQEVGAGEPVLFVHGAPNAGAVWAPLLAYLRDFRCLVLDRPGCGLSEPVDYASTDLRTLAVDVLGSVLDALDLTQPAVVGSSMGATWALWLAGARPRGIGRLVQLGCPALVEGMLIPPFLRLLATPGLNRVLARLPSSDTSVRATLRQIGHGASLDAGRLPAGVLAWNRHLLDDTATMGHEVRLIERGVSWRGVRPASRLRLEELSRVAQPTLLLWGEDDPFGGVELGRRVTAALPEATLEPFPRSGHLPWLDGPAAHASRIRTFLRAGSTG